MISFTKPSWDAIRCYVRSRTNAPLTYRHAELTRGDENLGHFKHDTIRIELGSGAEVWERARQAIADWKMFPQQMTELYWQPQQIDPGQVVAVLFRGPCFWSLNPCRIVYTVDESNRFGFAYGTVDGHLARGEESFFVNRDNEDQVWYELTAYSRPDHWLAWLGYPYVRLVQARFRRLSAESVHAAVTSGQE